jgi:hypothetical protein
MKYVVSLSAGSLLWPRYISGSLLPVMTGSDPGTGIDVRHLHKAYGPSGSLTWRNEYKE